MRTQKIPLLIATTSLLLLAGFFLFISMAGATPAAHVSGANSLIGAKNTDSAGSYSYEDEKGKKEGSKSKAYSHPKSQGKFHGKKEGSGSRKYAPSSHGYRHKKEGSGFHKREGSRGHGYSGHKGSHGKNPFQHILCFKKKLGLTEAQIKQIKSAEFAYKKFKVQSQASHAIAHMDLDRLVHAKTFDEAKIRSVGDRISEIKSADIHAMIEAKITALNILTPEQREKMNRMHSGHK